MANNSYQWQSERINLKPAPVLEMDTMNMLTAQIFALTKKVDSLNIQNNNIPTNVCENCAGPHPIWRV